jgi:hypothetical protein
MFSRKLDITLSYFVELVNNLFVSLLQYCKEIFSQSF